MREGLKIDQRGREMEKLKIHLKCLLLCISAVLLFTSFNSIISGADESLRDKPWEKSEFLSKPVRGGEFRVAATVDVGLLNPHHWPVMNWDLIDMLYEQYIVAGEKAVFNPWIAKSWHYRDPTTFIIQFREGVFFHDGSPLNAESVKYNLEWILDRKNGCWDRSYVTAIKSIEVLDDYTLGLHFHEPFAIFLSQLQMPPGYGMSVNALKGDIAIKESESLLGKIKSGKRKLAKLEEKANKAFGDDKEHEKTMKKLDKARAQQANLEKQYAEVSKLVVGAKKTDVYPVGTGPYMFDSRVTGNWVKLKRNPNYWYGKAVGRPEIPYFDSIKVLVIPDSSVQLANLRAGEIHEMELIPALYDKFSKQPDPNIRVDALNMPHTAMIIFNHAKGPCQDIRVRKAISHAIDRRALLMGARFGLGVLASCIFPGDQWSHNPNLKPVEYDPELSRKLLKEAGYAKGFSIRGHSYNTTEATTMASAVKNMLADVGIDWKYDVLDSVAVSDQAKNLEYDIAFSAWLYTFDPDMPSTGLYLPDGGFNYGRSKNDEAIALIEAGKKEYDFEKRQKIYWKIEEVLYNNYEDVWLWWPRQARAFTKSVRGTDAVMYERYMDAWKRSHYLSSLWFENSGD